MKFRALSCNGWHSSPGPSGPYRRWLMAEGSLTAHLRKRYPDFKVCRISEGWQRPLQDECASLGVSARQRAWVREVCLYGQGQPVVFAHSVIPRRSLRGPWRKLARQGDRPLGATLFALPAIVREPIRYDRLTPAHPLYQHARRACPDLPAVLWARRSVFRLSKARIMVTEVFLPAVLDA